MLPATTHTDLFEDLHPSVHIHKRFGKVVEVRYYPNQPLKECCMLREIKIKQRNVKDYRALAGFHYRSHNICAVRKIFKAIRKSEICGVIVYSYPPMAVSGRRKVLPRLTVQELNRDVSTIMRVVVHPKYRTIGLGQKLVRETLEHAGTPYVETTAVMAKYNPFFERAGMTKIQETQPPREAAAIRDVLASLTFNTTLLGSERVTLSKLTALTGSQLLTVKEAFEKHSHLRFMKEFFYHLPYGKKDAYKREVQTASLEKLTKLIRIAALLLQTKVYLFWQKY